MARSKAEPDVHRAALRGTPRERRRYVDARRTEAHERDARRHRLAHRGSDNTRFKIPRDRGFASFAPGALSGVEAVVAATLGLMDELGPDPRRAKGKDHLTTNLLPRESLSLDSAFMRLALNDEVVTAVSAYLGIVPVLGTVDVWHSRPVDREAASSQLFHLDFADTTQIKLFVHCTDVAEESGPLTVLDAARSKRVAKKGGYRIADARVSDEQVAQLLGDAVEPFSLTGPTGTAHFIDTSRCFHFGSRIHGGAPPRTVAVVQYLTPYAFTFERDHREEAPFRELATDSLPERQRLVLGAD